MPFGNAPKARPRIRVSFTGVSAKAKSPRSLAKSSCRGPASPRSPPDGRGSLFKSGDRRLILGVMARAGRELAIIHAAQLAAQRLLGDRDLELLPDTLGQIDQPPAHHAVNRRDRARVDPGDERCPMRVGELRGLARRLAVDQAR